MRKYSARLCACDRHSCNCAYCAGIYVHASLYRSLPGLEPRWACALLIRDSDTCICRGTEATSASDLVPVQTATYSPSTMGQPLPKALSKSLCEGSAWGESLSSWLAVLARRTLLRWHESSQLPATSTERSPGSWKRGKRRSTMRADNMNTARTYIKNLAK